MIINRNLIILSSEVKAAGFYQLETGGQAFINTSSVILILVVALRAQVKRWGWRGAIIPRARSLSGFPSSLAYLRLKSLCVAREGRTPRDPELAGSLSLVSSDRSLDWVDSTR
ncbi:hypothetical protein ElyMa_000599800 [Elysia marginata]|uniref:Uncharacterized protein n=1 Tax=Elysia marginata TaxID=1093978 RepID=A0AAV4G898_9GAST|nr:hypothetical protein ElyMa_000599800 [Elysia marginata]